MSQRPDDCLVTLEQMRDMREGDKYIVKIRDIDGVAPESRGKTFEITFVALDLADEFKRSLVYTELAEEPACYMIHGHSEEDPKLHYGFHAWLIEEITEEITPA